MNFFSLLLTLQGRAFGLGSGLHSPKCSRLVMVLVLVFLVYGHCMLSYHDAAIHHCDPHDNFRWKFILLGLNDVPEIQEKKKIFFKY